MPTEDMRVRVTVYVGADPNDKKFTLPLLQGIPKLDNDEIETYGFLTELQLLCLHEELTKIQAVARAVRSLKQRGV